ncbi:hypothetical protein K1719_016233 [Acacia pycnantha]|nr:hypothetical protein K1719_016233 [Acacia pycnantha]
MGYSVREMEWWVMAIIIFILLGFHGESEGCLKEEREALLKLKEAFNYPTTGSSLSSWSNLTLSDCCTWEAVECDNSTKRVIRLRLNGIRAYELRDVKWSLNASSFLPFHQLQRLDLFGNYLLGLFGDVRLANLEWLDLGENELIEVPSFVMSLSSLTQLFLARNKLSGLLPQQGLFGDIRLTNLEFLALDDNELKEVPSFGDKSVF